MGFEGNRIYGVCTKHLRFLPCRKKGPCEYSNSLDDVSTVSWFQQGAIPGLKIEKTDRMWCVYSPEKARVGIFNSWREAWDYADENYFWFAKRYYTEALYV